MRFCFDEQWVLEVSIYGWRMEWGGTFHQNVQAALRLAENY